MSKDNKPMAYERTLTESVKQILAGIAIKVNQTMDNTVVAVAKAKMDIGVMLNNARELFKGDKEFGQWRSRECPNLSPTEASYCMNAARKYADADDLIKKVGWSALRELVYLPDDKIAQLNEAAGKLADGEKLLSTSEARTVAKAERDLQANGTPVVERDTPPATHIPTPDAGAKRDISGSVGGGRTSVGVGLPPATILLTIGSGQRQKTIRQHDAERMDIEGMLIELADVTSSKTGPSLEDAFMAFGITDPEFVTEGAILPTILLQMVDSIRAELLKRMIPDEAKLFNACYDKVVAHIKSVS